MFALAAAMTMAAAILGPSRASAQWPDFTATAEWQDLDSYVSKMEDWARQGRKATNAERTEYNGKIRDKANAAFTLANNRFLFLEAVAQATINDQMNAELAAEAEFYNQELATETEYHRQELEAIEIDFRAALRQEKLDYDNAVTEIIDYWASEIGPVRKALKRAESRKHPPKRKIARLETQIEKLSQHKVLELEVAEGEHADIVKTIQIDHERGRDRKRRLRTKRRRDRDRPCRCRCRDPGRLLRAARLDPRQQRGREGVRGRQGREAQAGRAEGRRVDAQALSGARSSPCPGRAGLS